MKLISKDLKLLKSFVTFANSNRQHHTVSNSLSRRTAEFNYEVIVDVMYLDARPVLHVIDEATAFQAARFLASISAKDT